MLTFDIGALGHIEGIGHLKAVTAGHTQTGQQLVEVGGAVGRAHLHGLLDGGVEVARAFLLRVGDAHMSTSAVQPSGTRTSTERLRSPQQTFVGASWCGTRRK